MQIIRGYHCFPNVPNGTVVTIGNYDGVHLGHQAVLQAVVERAKAAGLASVLVVFEPMPKELFAGDAAPERLSSLREKVAALQPLGLDYLVVQRFTAGFAKTAADKVITEHWLGALQAKQIIVGDDFRFGAKRAGDYALLERMAAQHHYLAANTESLMHSGLRVSSTAIRSLLVAGELQQAAEALGRPYTMLGRVIKGRQLGRTIGFPTANIAMTDRRSALSGVYAVTARNAAGSLGTGVANIGYKPTVGGTGLSLEVHLFNDDIDESLYGQRIEVAFHHFIRQEQKFASLEALQQQISKDVNTAKAYFGK